MDQELLYIRPSCAGREYVLVDSYYILVVPDLSIYLSLRDRIGNLKKHNDDYCSEKMISVNENKIEKSLIIRVGGYEISP